jgi:hypothetical protein
LHKLPLDHKLRRVVGGLIVQAKPIIVTRVALSLSAKATSNSCHLLANRGPRREFALPNAKFLRSLVEGEELVLYGDPLV